RLWDLSAEAAPRLFCGHHGEVRCLSFSSDSRLLASGCADRAVRVWSVMAGSLVAWLPCADQVMDVWFDPQRPQLRVADAGGAARVPNFYLLELMAPV